MEKIKLNGQQVIIPTSWDEVKLGDYEKWDTNKPQDQMSNVHYIADLCKVDADKLLNAPDNIFERIENILQFASKTDFQPSQTITIHNELYTVASSDKLTLGEWIDMEAIINGESQTPLSDMLAIVCRPIGEDYDHEKSLERAKLFREQSCEKMMPLIRFFLYKKIELDEILNHFSTVVEAATQFLQDTKTFVANGDGIKQLPIWQRGRYSSLIKSREKELSKFSDSSSIASTNHMPSSTK